MLTLSQLDLSLFRPGPVSRPPTSGESFSSKLLSSRSIHTRTHTHPYTHTSINVYPFKTSGPHNSGVTTQTFNTGEDPKTSVIAAVNKGIFVCVCNSVM